MFTIYTLAPGGMCTQKSISDLNVLVKSLLIGQFVKKGISVQRNLVKLTSRDLNNVLTLSKG